MNPSNMGVGGNTSLPPPLQLDSRNAPVASVLIPLGKVTQRDSDGNIESSSTASAAGNGTGNKEKGEIPLTSVAGLNAATVIDTTAVGNDTVNNEHIADLADNFQKILRSEQKGLAPELKNQSPQEKYLRALSTLDNLSVLRMEDRNTAKAVFQASKTSGSWLQAYVQSISPESTLAPAQLMQDLKEFSESQDLRKYLDENMQLVTFGDKVVVVTSPDFLKEHAMPSAMMRKCAKDLIENRSLMDYGTGESEYYLQDEDRYNILANYFTMASPSEEDKGAHHSGSRISRRIRTKELGTEDTDTNMSEKAISPSTLIMPFTLEEKLVALEDTRAKGLSLNVFALSFNPMRINS